MEPVNIYEAKTRLSQLVDQAAAGDDVVIGRNGKPVARLTRLEAGRRPAQAVYVSAASVWEIAIKARHGKIDADPV